MRIYVCTYVPSSRAAYELLAYSASEVSPASCADPSPPPGVAGSYPRPSAQ
jgi:hypothetical protein